MKTVAIKKIPISTLAGAFGDHSNSGKASQLDVDHFVACIVDHHSRESDHGNGRDNNASTSINGARRENSTTSRNGNGMTIQIETSVPSMISKQMGFRDRDRVVQCLGCHQADSELWVGARALVQTVRWRIFVSPNAQFLGVRHANMRERCRCLFATFARARPPCFPLKNHIPPLFTISAIARVSCI